MKRLAILGEIGSGNLGDDLGYVLFRDALIRAFDERDMLVDIRPLTPNLHHTLGGYHWDAVVTGLGTLLDHAHGQYVHTLRSVMQKCPIGIFGTGVSDPAHQVPTDEGRKALHDILGNAAVVWIRGEAAGAQYAGPDLGWLLGDRAWPAADALPARTLVGINVGYAAWSRYGVDRVIELLRAARQYMRSTQQFVAAWDNDRRYLTDLDAAMPIHHVTGTRAGLAELLKYKTCFCTRVHLAVFAACMGVRPVLLDYSTKVAEVFHGAPEVLQANILRGNDAVSLNQGSYRALAEALEATPLPSDAARAAVRTQREDVERRVREGVERLCAKAGW